MDAYAKKIDALLSPSERQILRKLTTAQLIQDFLDHFPVNFPKKGEGIHSPSWVLKNRRAHCIEAALLAATTLAYYGKPAFLMDIQSDHFDYDHVVALFTQNGLWGAISKTNHNVLRWRDPVYKTPRELALSYFHEYFWPDTGKRFRTKTMLAYSKPFNLKKYAPKKYFGVKNLNWLAEELDSSPHLPAYPKRTHKFLRKASKLEVKAMRLAEWRDRS